MLLQDVLKVLRGVAPEYLAESWDRVGLQLGDLQWRVDRAMLCIDLTEPVLAEAVAKKANLMVAYHPPIFSDLKRLTTQHWKQRIVLGAAERRIAIYSPHTALDAAPGGVNDWLCSGIGQGRVTPLEPRPKPNSQTYKVVTFIPPGDHAEALRHALAEAGAGQIGHYRECSFAQMGQGTFCGGPDAKPLVGRAGRLERLDELRIEMVCSRDALNRVITTLKAIHPYEEPAFDVYRLIGVPQAESVGQGRRLVLDRPVSVRTLLQRLKKHLGVRHLEASVPVAVAAEGLNPGSITTIHLCAGAGGSILQQTDPPADAYFTGEMRHHDVLDAVEQGRVVVLAGHTQTERPFLPAYRQLILDRGGSAVTWIVSESDRAPEHRV